MNKPSRNPWPLTIIAFFAVFIMGIVAFVVFASRHHEDLVRPDYYEQEVRFQEQMEREHRTAALRQNLTVNYDQQHQSVVITLPPDHAALQPSGTVKFYRPSDAGLDRILPLATGLDGIQRLDASTLRAGLWKVRVSWTVSNAEYYFDQPIVVGGIALN